MNQRTAGGEALDEQRDLGRERKGTDIRILDRFVRVRPTEAAQPAAIPLRDAQVIAVRIHQTSSPSARRMPDRVKGRKAPWETICTSSGVTSRISSASNSSASASALSGRAGSKE